MRGRIESCSRRDITTPSGGRAYPLSTPGGRASKLIPDTCNRYGVNFHLRDPAFMIGEAQFRLNKDKTDAGLATIFKFGGSCRSYSNNPSNHDIAGI